MVINTEKKDDIAIGVKYDTISTGKHEKRYVLNYTLSVGVITVYKRWPWDP